MTNPFNQSTSRYVALILFLMCGACTSTSGSRTSPSAEDVGDGTVPADGSSPDSGADGDATSLETVSTDGSDTPGDLGCDDGTQNGSESDVDCGGACPACSTGRQCRAWSDCESKSCEAGTCASDESTCQNGQKDGDESDVDCGGACAPCTAGKACGTWTDCASESCTAGMCQGDDGAVSCSNGVKDGVESDVDCGGGTCAKCEPLHACKQPSDCLTGHCGTDGKCHQAGCYNGKKDGIESSNDCGGDCEPCGPDVHCNTSVDCVEGLSCDAITSKCTEPCSDGVLSPGEADVDCGGPCPLGCFTGQDCTTSLDCMFDVCNSGQCKSASEHCYNGFLDGDETDSSTGYLDCGGTECLPCQYGRVCKVDGDCKSGSCADGVCVLAVSCSNGVLDAGETDLDCGGKVCAPCQVGAKCDYTMDCESKHCKGTCKEAACDDGQWSGDETGKDCGGPTCPKCADGLACESDSDCLGGACTGGRCGRCDDGLLNGTETDVDCGGICGKCPKGSGCFFDSDCDATPCENGTCGGCTDGVKGNYESDVDCGGSCADCAVGKGCNYDGDCASKACDPESETCCAPNACGECGDVPVEKCNGWDDDCNGSVDDLAEPPQCPKQVGVCQGSTGICQGGSVKCDYEDIPGYDWNDDVCDGLDGDCDGQPDLAKCDFCTEPVVTYFPFAGKGFTDFVVGTQAAVIDMPDFDEGPGVYLRARSGDITANRVMHDGGFGTLSDTYTSVFSRHRTRNCWAVAVEPIFTSDIAKAGLFCSEGGVFGLSGEVIELDIPFEQRNRLIPFDVRWSQGAMMSPYESDGSIVTLATVTDFNGPNSPPQSFVVAPHYNDASRIVLSPDGKAHAFLQSPTNALISHRVVGDAATTNVAVTGFPIFAPLAAADGWLHLAYVSTVSPKIRMRSRNADGQWLSAVNVAASSLTNAVDLVEDGSGAVILGWVDGNGNVRIGRREPSGFVAELGTRTVTSNPAYVPFRLTLGPAALNGGRVIVSALASEEPDLAMSTLTFCPTFAPSCIPDCEGRNCGSDGCGGTCGTCAETEACSAVGVCVGALGPVECFPASAKCDPVTNDGCNDVAGAACDVMVGSFQCYDPPNDVPIGGSCDTSKYCVPTSTCVGYVCRKFCCASSDCTVGTCKPLDFPGFNGYSIGTCQP